MSNDIRAVGDSNPHASVSLFVASDGTMIALQYVELAFRQKEGFRFHCSNGDVVGAENALCIVMANNQGFAFRDEDPDAKRFVQALLDYHDIRMGVPCEH